MSLDINHKNNILVSIITPTYNRASFLSETIESVLNQSYSNFEYIILDDGSTDETQQILKKYQDPRIISLYHDNMGETATVNKAIVMAKGQIVGIVNSDDPILPGAIQEAVSCMAARPELLAVYPDWLCIGPESEFIKVEYLKKYNIENMLLDFNFGLGPGAFIRRSSYDLIGCRKPYLRYTGDMDFWLRLALQGTIHHIPKVLATHRHHLDSASVFAKGRLLSYELTTVIKSILKSPLLPASILKKKSNILAYVYSVAAKSYAGNDKYSIIKYSGLSFYYRCISIRYHFIDALKRMRNNLRRFRWNFLIMMAFAIILGVVGLSYVRRYFIKLKLFVKRICSRVFYGVLYRLSKLKNKVLGFMQAIGSGIKRHTWKFVEALLPTLKRYGWKIIDPAIDVACFILPIFVVPILRLSFGFPVWGARKKQNLNQNKNKFAFSTRFLPPMWSGQAVVINRLLTGLDPKFYCLVTQPVYADRKANNFIGALPATYYDLPVEKLWIKSTPTKWVRWANLISAIFQRGINIARALKNENVGTIIVGTGDQVDPPATCLAAHLLGCRFFAYFFDDYTEQFWADQDMLPLLKMLERIVAKRSNGLIAPNEYMQKVLITRYNQVAAIVRNPHPFVDFPDFQTTASNTQGKEIKLVFTGAIYNLNYDIFRSIIAGIKLLPQMNIKLHIYTAQPFEVLKQEGLWGEHVELHMHVPSAEVALAQNEADILLIPFSFEPRAVGIVKSSATGKLADYLMTGKPIVAICPKDSFLDWYFTRYECGIIIPREDPHLIAETIARIINDPELQNRMGQNAQARARIDFDPVLAQKTFLKTIGVELSA